MLWYKYIYMYTYMYISFTLLNFEELSFSLFDEK